jgi:hypothetical protein
VIAEPPRTENLTDQNLTERLYSVAVRCIFSVGRKSKRKSWITRRRLQERMVL